MSDEYPDMWKAPADRRKPGATTVRYGSTGSGARFPLVTHDPGYPSVWPDGREPSVIDGVVELDGEDG